MRRFVSAADGKVYELDPDKKYFTNFGKDFEQNNLQQALAVFTVLPGMAQGHRATLRSGHIVSHWTDLDR